MQIILFILFNPARSAMFFKSPSGWLFIEHTVRFFSIEDWLFIEIVRHVVRSGLSSWMRKTCFQAAMPASMTTGCNPANNRFLFSFPAGVCALILRIIRLKNVIFFYLFAWTDFRLWEQALPSALHPCKSVFCQKKENHSIKSSPRRRKSHPVLRVFAIKT